MSRLKNPERDWLFWLQRVTFLVIPLATVLFMAVSFFIDTFLAVNESVKALLWNGLIIYAIPVPAAVLAMAWIRPYAGSITALIAIPVVTVYYLSLSAVFDSLTGSYTGTLREFLVFYLPEVFLFMLGAGWGFAWKKKWRKSQSFIRELRELNPYVF